MDQRVGFLDTVAPAAFGQVGGDENQPYPVPGIVGARLILQVQRIAVCPLARKAAGPGRAAMDGLFGKGDEMLGRAGVQAREPQACRILDPEELGGGHVRRQHPVRCRIDDEAWRRHEPAEEECLRAVAVAPCRRIMQFRNFVVHRHRLRDCIIFAAL